MNRALPDFPWRGYLGNAVGVLGVAPTDFWALTPRECRAALHGYAEARGGRAAAPPSREEIEEMMRRFPD